MKMKLSALAVQEAPLRWLIQQHRQAISSILLIVGGILFALTAVVVFLKESGAMHGTWSKWAAFQLSVVSSLPVFGRMLQKCKDDEKYEQLVLIIMLIISVGQHISVLTVSSTIQRARTQIASILLIKAVVVKMGLTMKTTVCYSVLCFLIELFFCYAGQQLYGDEYTFGFPVGLATWHGLHLCFCANHHTIMRDLYDAQNQYKEEKDACEVLANNLSHEKQESAALLLNLRSEREAFESLLNKICDATLWLGADGDTIVHSDAHFASIVGCNMQGSLLSSRMSEADKRRWQLAFSQNRQNNELVQLLPTSICEDSGKSKVDVDVFIVCRGKHFIESNFDLQPCYLLGIRVSQQDLGLPESPATLTTQIIAHPTVLRPFDVAATSNSSSFDTDSVVMESRIYVEHSKICERRAALQATALRDVLVEDEWNVVSLHPTWQQSGHYLDHCLEDVITDLVGCINLRSRSCCGWHGSCSHLIGLAQNIFSKHNCSTQPPQATFQCRYCLAIVAANQNTDFCWICSQDLQQDGADAGELTRQQVH